MLALDSLVDIVRTYHPAADLDLIRKAYRYSEWAHQGQTRKSGEPYFVHPASVAGLITELRLDTASVCAGLLHDVLEDTKVTNTDLEREFGPEVTTIVDGVTKLGKINFSSREDRQAESFGKMVVARAHFARDARDLRAARVAPRHAAREERARGPRVSLPRARRLQRAGRQIR